MVALAASLREPLMPTFRPIRLALAAAAMSLVALATPAFATPGVTTRDAQVLSVPNSGAVLLGTMGASQRIDVLGCSGAWCKVSGGGLSGWIGRDFIVFRGGVQPPTISPDSGAQTNPPRPPRPGNNNGPGFSFDFNFGNGNPGPFPPREPPRPPRPEPSQRAQACFYSATNFRGDSFCVDRGQSYAYLPDDWDDAIRSVEIFGRARVDLCRDEDLEGACATLRSSQSRLPNQIDRRVSSLEVY
jgi:Beta/Gamma crystallin